jgi:hypothetical protein
MNREVLEPLVFHEKFLDFETGEDPNKADKEGEEAKKPV